MSKGPNSEDKETSNGSTAGDKLAVTHAKEAPTYLCEFCGPDKPASQVYVCTLCTMSFCINHLHVVAHDCSIGAFGKPHSVGVGGPG